MQIFIGKKRPQNALKSGFGRVLASIWEGSGVDRALFGALLGLLARFFRVRIRIFSNIAFAYVSDGIEDGFSID